MSNNNRTYYELTHPQKRIWFIDKINSNSPLHNIGGCLNIKGAIDIETMKKTLNLIIENNDGLRLRFIETASQPMQYVAEYVEQEIDFFDFSKCENPGKEYKKWSGSVFEKCFSIGSGWLFYFAIYKINEENSGVLFNAHHLISDGWSSILIERQVCETYGKLMRGQEITFDKNNSYIEFIKEEKKYLSSVKFLKNKDFWLDKFKNPFTEFLYNSTSSVKGRRDSVDIDESLSSKIKDFAATKGCSLNTLFIAVLLIYVYKTTGKKDITIGTAVFNRTTRAQRNMAGMFTSTMPLRFALDTETAGAFIEKLSKALKPCFLNQKYPYDLLIKELELGKSGYDSLFQMSVNYYNMELEMDIAGMGAQIDEYYNGNQSYSMQLTVKEWKENRITLNFDYKVQEYSRSEIKAMQKAIVNITSQLINEKSIIKHVKLLSEKEINHKMYGLNATIKRYPQKTVCELFEEQASKQPDKIALEFGDTLFTYKELNEKSNQMANYLKEKGIGKKSVVAVMETHTPEIVISILGVMKTGGTYVPIDPNYPSGRINYILEDSQCRLLLTNFSIKIIPFCGDIVNVNHVDFNIFSKNNLTVEIGMDDVAYMIYTSGSTGSPKSAMIKHLSLTNYIVWAGKTYFKSENEAMALYSSIAFDLTVTSLFAPLITGNKIVIYESDEKEFVLYKILRGNKVTVIKLTPAHLSLLVKVDYSKSKVKIFIVGGDDLKVSLAKLISVGFDSVDIYNEYGPTEATVGCMIHRYDEESDIGLSVPIGRPIDNVQIYLLDGNLDAVPTGLTGEIYISGDGVALGYLNNDELTNEKFIENPFVVGQKMYKTGDLARYLESGLIEYMGRADNQVKIRGHRVELGEIEQHITKIGSVKSAAVVLKESSQGNRMINAYVVSVGISEKELKNRLSEDLPHYMIPSNFIFMDALPLTINGKVDTSLLPEPTAVLSEFSEGETPAEKELILAIEDVLGISGVGMNDNFYQLGGDSIKAIQVSSKLNNVGFKVKARDILSYEIIREIADYIETTDSWTIEQDLVSGSFMPTPIIKWFFEQNFADKNHYNQSILLEAERFNVAHIEKAVSKLIRHHDSLRLNYSGNGDLYYNNTFSDFSVDYYDLSDYPENYQEEKVKELGNRLKSGFDIENGLLFKACVFNLGKRGQMLLLTAHHLVVDGVSWRIILEDLDCMLSQLENNMEISLPPKTHSFMKWSEELEGYAKNEFEAEMQYWSFISGQNFHFPVDFDKGSYTMIKTLHAELDTEPTKQLLKNVNDIYGLNPQETMIIALATVIRNVSAQDDVMIEIEGHGREEIGKVNISRTVGWFTSMYPVHLRVLNKGIDQNIIYLKEQLRNIPNKGLDFGVLKYLINKLENSGFYVRFNYLGDFDGSLRDKAFRMSNMDCGPDIGKKNHMTAILDINAMILDKKLVINLTFSENKFREETARDFLNAYVERIIEIIDLCGSGTEKKFTPSDFTESEITQEDLDTLFL
ncbi:MAG: amino acid adenylation domain-containing protein [Bacillota bacterium]